MNFYLLKEVKIRQQIILKILKLIKMQILKSAKGTGGPQQNSGPPQNSGQPSIKMKHASSSAL